jgi:leader peptidase (prepilin peptidase) / N-methyltransferase
MPNLSPIHLTILWTSLGLLVGSFLNVCIYRLPLEGESVNRPRRSRCPSCKTPLTWKENVPLISWALQLGRCRTCSWRIPVRYPLVEALNAGLWYLAISTAGSDQPGLWITWSIVLSALLVATMVDFDCFEIPDEVSIGGMVFAPIFCLLIPQLHQHTGVALSMSDGGTVDRIGALIAGFAGMAVGGGVLWVIGWLGTKAYKTEAMGFGDVKLLAAGGGFIGPGGALAALMIAALFASVFGVANVLRFLCLTRRRARARGRRDPWGRSIGIARIAGRYLPFGPFLALGIGIVLLRWEDVRAFLPL